MGSFQTIQKYQSSLFKDRLTYLGKKYIAAAEGRSQIMELLVSEYNVAEL
jgi:hypothetical protein